MDDEAVAAHLRTTRKIIEDHGWTIQPVMGKVPFFYSVGMTERGLPEILIVIDLDVIVAHSIINDVARRVISGTVLENFGRLDEVIENFPVYTREVLNVENEESFMVINAMYRTKPRRVFQLFFPDPKGRFPWDAGCSYRNNQLSRGFTYAPITSINQ